MKEYKSRYDNHKKYNLRESNLSYEEWLEDKLSLSEKSTIFWVIAALLLLILVMLISIFPEAILN